MRLGLHLRRSRPEALAQLAHLTLQMTDLGGGRRSDRRPGVACHCQTLRARTSLNSISLRLVRVHTVCGDP